MSDKCNDCLDDNYLALIAVIRLEIRGELPPGTLWEVIAELCDECAGT